MLLDQPVLDEDNGDVLGVDETTQEHEQPDGSSLEKSDEERKRAITESIRLSKEVKGARAELSTAKVEKEFLIVENAVLKGQLDIKDVYASSPDVANIIAQNAGFASYDDFQSKQNPPATPQGANVDVRQLVRDELSSRSQEAEKEKINDEVIQFFVERKISEKSPVFRKVVQEFNTYDPKSVVHAKRLLKVIFEDATEASHGNEASSYDINALPSHQPQARESSQQSARTLSPAARKLAEEQYGADVVKKFLSSK